MITAYKKARLPAQEKLNFAKQLQKEGYMDPQISLEDMKQEAGFFHPSWPMRILLFIVGYFGFSGLMGLGFFMVENMISSHWQSFLLGAGLLGFVAFEGVIIRSMNHFKSGLTEAVLYTSMSMVLGGFAEFIDRFETWGFLLFAAILAAAAIRYVDKFLTIMAVLCVGGFLFFLCQNLGVIFQNLVPFVFMAVFASIYFFTRKLETQESLRIWHKQILVLQSLSLLLVYAGGNYFVVHELDRAVNDTYLAPGENIAFAWIFYAFTILLPALFLFFGIKHRDRILIWAGLLSAGFSVFTFKYYFSLGHPEITLTISGVLLLGVAVFLLNKLKQPVHGFTREKLAATDVDALTAEGVFISQTMGGITTKTQEQELFQGGGFGGGGASGNVD